ncbi:hypothetical protein KOI35_43305 [Actinoplanes bogorensis]|uniref:Uncharacterized protein n=1 Tax=Paractinoplanes bogorensis TaxID=1610840 RepID=A0ABS5Z477_9ACTN|nr:DUF6461 domain-containing protein [Actinoplanes bogorensis]MBU2670351.1 hypothetical protein [Actinoplanes bogorensis]
MVTGDALATFVAAAMPHFVERVPAAPARVLGRLGASGRPESAPFPEDAFPYVAFESFAPDDPAALVALDRVGRLTSERLLGALELAIGAYPWGEAPDLLDGIPGPPDEFGYFSVSGGHEQSEAWTAASLLDRLRPGLVDRTADLVRELAAHPGITPLLAVPADVVDEDAIAAAHGAAFLGLSVAVAGAVAYRSGLSALADPAAASVGMAAGVAAVLLGESSMPPRYAEAALAKRRAEYVPFVFSSAYAAVAGHRFGLVEHGLPETVDFRTNGLAAVTDGGVVIRTGVAEGQVEIEMNMLDGPPDEIDAGWEEVVDVSWHATEGGASVSGPYDDDLGPRHITPPWPGDYRVRVHARGRDDDADESYKISVWSGPAEPERVHRRTDRLGHRLRGEVEPVRVPRPEQAYRWIRRSSLVEAATVTVVTGSTREQVLRAFGADPARPQPFGDIQRELDEEFDYGVGPWVTVLETGGAVLVVEFNGYEGAESRVLEAASSGGRAASMYWNVNAVTRHSFAERGRLLATFEHPEEEDLPPEVSAALAGLDFERMGEFAERGLVGVERFTGHGITQADLARIEEAGLGYRVVS